MAVKSVPPADHGLFREYGGKPKK